MWREANQKVDVGEREKVVKRFTALAQWDKQKEAARLCCGGCGKEAPLEGLYEFDWCVFWVDPTKVVA